MELLFLLCFFQSLLFATNFLIPTQVNGYLLHLGRNRGLLLVEAFTVTPVCIPDVPGEPQRALSNMVYSHVMGGKKKFLLNYQRDFSV